MLFIIIISAFIGASLVYTATSLDEEKKVALQSSYGENWVWYAALLSPFAFGKHLVEKLPAAIAHIKPKLIPLKNKLISYFRQAK